MRNALASPRLHALLLLFAVWYIAAQIFPPIKVPHPARIANEMVELFTSGEAWPHIWATTFRIVLGFLGATFVGGALGVIIGLGGFWKDPMADLVSAGLSMPAIAWAAICTILFGVGLASPVLATILTVFPYIAVNIAKGVENIDRNLVTMARVYRISRWQLFRDVILPSVSPQIFAAVRYGIALSWKIVTIAEFFAATEGMGYMIVYSYGVFSLAGVLAWSLVFTALTLLLEYGVFQVAEKHIFRWRPRAL